MARSSKLAEIESVGEFSHWLADTIQQKVAKENAGFVHIERPRENRVRVKGKQAFQVAIEIEKSDA